MKSAAAQLVDFEEGLCRAIRPIFRQAMLIAQKDLKIFGRRERYQVTRTLIETALKRVLATEELHMDEWEDGYE